MEKRPLILLTGANGQVGREISRRADAFKLRIIACSRSDLDITDISAVKRCVEEVGPRLIINAAAYTAVDRAEEEREKAFAVNATGPKNIARVCRSKNIPLLHLSTDYVFDGAKSTPYTELDLSNPLGVYGESKLAGELLVQETLEQYFILRISWVFGATGRNFVKTILRLAMGSGELKIVADQVGGPTWAGDVADTLLKVSRRYIDNEEVKWGLYNYCGKPHVSWYDFAAQIVDQAKAQGILATLPELVPITTEDYKTLAERPKNSCLDCSLIQNELGIAIPEWITGLRKTLSELKTSGMECPGHSST